MSNKKVLHVVNISFVINHFIGNQCEYFYEKGYEFTVACTEDDNLHQLGKQKKFRPFPVAILRQISPLQDVKSIYKLYKFIKEEEFDYVIAHSPKGGLIGMIAAFLAGTKSRVFFRHGLVFETAKGFKRTMLILIEKLTGFLATKVVNVSQSLMIESDKYRLNAQKKNIILGKGTCNGIDLQRFKFRPKKNNLFTVGYVGRLSVDKGIVELVSAWERIMMKNNNIKLLLIGPLDVRDPLPYETLDKIKTISNIDHVGLIQDTSRYYNDMDLFVLPSYREGFGMVILEASASEIPVITTRKTGCVNAIIENETGVFSEINALDIEKNIQYFIDNPFIRREMGRNGRKFVEDNFSEAFLYDQIEKKVFED